MGRRKYTRKEIKKAEKLLGVSVFCAIILAIIWIAAFDFIELYYGDGPIIDFITEWFVGSSYVLFAAPFILYVIGLIVGSFIGIDIGPKTRK